MSLPPPLQVYRVFLSSTNDPQSREYRTAAKDLILKEFSTKWNPLDMKDFDPSSYPPIEACREAVLSCHVYIGILGAFYGSVNQKVDMSYTEYEFGVALEEKREIAIFLLPDKVVPDTSYQILIEQGPLFARQFAFRRCVQAEETGLTVKMISDLEEFKISLRSYLNQIKLKHPKEGLLESLKPPGPKVFLGDYPHLRYDRRPVLEYTVEDMDDEMLRVFLEQPNARSVLRREGLLRASKEDHLQMLGLLYESKPTLGAFLCFAPRRLLIDKFSACSLHMAVYNDVQRASSRTKVEEVSNNLLNLFEIGMNFLITEAGLRRTGEIGTKERDDLEIPEIALREALANALVHRDYEHPDAMAQPARIDVYPNRIDITSFGGLVAGISEDVLNKDTENIFPIRRNDNIARIFMIMQNVELNGSGIIRMREATRKANLLTPTIIEQQSPASVRVTFYRPTLKSRPRLVDNSTARFTVLISSTAQDLPEIRQEAMAACLRQGMFPVMMEHLAANDADRIAETLRLVDEADIYLGIFAHRYGYVPKGYDISISEMEYNRAMERGIPRLIFFIHDDHPVKASDVEKGEGAVKLEKFRERLRTERVVNFFESPADLRAHVINSLSNYRERDQTAFHYVSDIPKPPEVYIAHPYTLLQTRDLIGRQNELNLLTDWVAKPRSAVYQARIFNVVAIGGLGKSALTWKWFNDIAPNEMKPLAGRMWWSFYESDATFENFIIRALAYVTRRAREDIEKNTMPGEREEILLATLNREPFLLVLDGLERILIAYARMDAKRLADDDLDQQTANVVAGMMGLPENAAQSFTGQHRLRKTADPRAGNFLRKLARARASRTLVSTRLYPADLQSLTGEPLPSSFAHFIGGLSDDDALNLWRTFGVSGSRDELLRLFQIFGSHPLLIQALAGEIAHYYRAPGDFDIWRSNHPDFDPFSLPLVQARSHILEFALRGLNEPAKKVLHTVAPFRMPATYDTLAALLIGEDKIFSNENELDVALRELEDRGLLGWDKRGNRYDLHPIVRGVVWAGLSDDMRRDVYTTLHAHFEAIPKIEEFEVESLEDLAPAIELYNTLIGLGRYNDAHVVFQDRISDATLYRLSASRQRVELLEMLFPDGLDQLPRLSNPARQAFMLNELALGYQFSGQPGRAVPLFRRDLAIVEREGDQENLSTGLQNLSVALRLSGALSESQLAALQSFVIERKRGDLLSEGVSVQELGLILAARGLVDKADQSLRRALRVFSVQENRQGEGVGNASMSQLALWKADHAAAVQLANRAWELANVQRYERDFIRAARLQGASSLELNDLARADERLHHALTRARAVNLVDEEIQALIALAELRRQQGDSEAARELLDAVWESAERGPYPLLHADALNVLAQIERDAGNTIAAIEAATQAYRKAWCDGPPFAYHWGLEAARAHLNALGAPEPSDLPPYDESKHEPMPEVEIDPPDAPVDAPEDAPEV